MEAFIIFQSSEKKMKNPSSHTKDEGWGGTRWWDCEMGFYKRAIENQFGNAGSIWREILNAPNCVTGDWRSNGSKCIKKGMLEVHSTIVIYNLIPKILHFPLQFCSLQSNKHGCSLFNKFLHFQELSINSIREENFIKEKKSTCFRE